MLQDSAKGLETVLRHGSQPNDITSAVNFYSHLSRKSSELAEPLGSGKSVKSDSIVLQVLTAGTHSSRPEIQKASVSALTELSYELFLRKKQDVLVQFLLGNPKGISGVLAILRSAPSALLLPEISKFFAQLSRFCFPKLFFEALKEAFRFQNSYFLIIFPILKRLLLFKGFEKFLKNHSFADFSSEFYPREEEDAWETQSPAAEGKSRERTTQLLLLGFLWQRVPHDFDNSPRLCEFVADQIKYLVRKSDSALKFTLFGLLLDLCQTTTHLRLSAGPSLYKQVVFSFFEEYLDEEIRNFFIQNLVGILREVPVIPVKILAEVFCKQLGAKTELTVPEISLAAAISAHPKLNAASAVKLYRILARFYQQSLFASRLLDRPLSALAKRFVTEEDFKKCLVETVQKTMQIFGANCVALRGHSFRTLTDPRDVALSSFELPDQTTILRHHSSSLLNLVKDILCLDADGLTQQLIREVVKADLVILTVTGQTCSQIRVLLQLAGDDEVVAQIYAELEEQRAAEAKQKLSSAVQEMSGKTKAKATEALGKTTQKSHTALQKMPSSLASVTNIVSQAPKPGVGSQKQNSPGQLKSPETLLTSFDCSDIRPPKSLSPGQRDAPKALRLRPPSKMLPNPSSHSRGNSILRQGAFLTENCFVFVGKSTPFELRSAFEEVARANDRYFQDFFKEVRGRQKAASFTNDAIAIDKGVMQVSNLVKFLARTHPTMDEGVRGKLEMVNKFLTKNSEDQSINVRFIRAASLPLFMLNAFLAIEGYDKVTPDLEGKVRSEWPGFLKRCFIAAGVHLRDETQTVKKMCAKIVLELVERVLKTRPAEPAPPEELRRLTSRPMSLFELESQTSQVKEPSIMGRPVGKITKPASQPIKTIPFDAAKREAEMAREFEELKKERLRRERAVEIQEKIKKMKDEKLLQLRQAEEERERQIREKEAHDREERERKKSYLRQQKERVRKYKEEQLRHLTELEGQKQDALRSRSMAKKQEVASFLKLQSEKLQEHFVEIRRQKEEERARMEAEQAKQREKFEKVKALFKPRA